MQLLHVVQSSFTPLIKLTFIDTPIDTHMINIGHACMHICAVADRLREGKLHVRGT